jgi:hypothetical protein
MRGLILAFIAVAGCQQSTLNPNDLYQDHGWIDPSDLAKYPRGFQPVALSLGLAPCLDLEILNEALAGWEVLNVTISFHGLIDFQFVCSQSDTEWDGLTDLTQRIISLNAAFLTSATQPEIRQAIAHEIGHALGMQHVRSPFSLMFPRVSPINQITEEDLLQYYRKYGN